MSIVVLARDEERCIARCLDSLVGRGADDVLVVDTGSVDATLDIVRGYAGSGVRLIEHPWADSFAQARNLAIECVGNGWVVFLDADEWLTERSARQLISCLSSLDGLVGLSTLMFSPRIHDAGSGEIVDECPRIFRAEGQIRFRGAIHEYPVLRGTEDAPVGMVGLDLDLLHDGYDRHIVDAKDKLTRNLTLLDAARRADPGNPRWVFFQLRDALSVIDGTRIGNLCGALHEMTETGANTGDRYDARSYYRRALSLACGRLVALGHLLAVHYHCDQLDALDGRDNPDAHYFRSMLALLGGTATNGDLLRTVRLRGDDALVATSAVDPNGRHLDALIAAQLAKLRSESDATRYLELCRPWDDVFFERSMLRPELTSVAPQL